MICVGDKELPQAFQEADAESRLGQRSYTLSFLLLLVATSFAAAGTWISTDTEGYKLHGSVIAAIATLAAFVITTILSTRNFEQAWYTGRAVAESVKTRSWSYMMRGERYPSSISFAEADKRFVEDLGDILKQAGPLVFKTALVPSTPQISAMMREVRESAITNRLSIYLQCRVQDQSEWYRLKARRSARLEKSFFLCMQALQVISFVTIGYALYHKTVTSGGVGLLAAISASVIAWLQVKKYQETAQAYAITHQELLSVEALASSVTTEGDLAQFVQDSENAISREHTLWVAKRVIR